MTRRRLQLLGVCAAALIVAAAGFLAGRELKPASQAAILPLDAPAYRAAEDVAVLSRGGFSGFGETPGLPGRTVLAGKVVSLTGGEVTLESADGIRSSLRVAAGEDGLSRIEPAGRETLRPGVEVVVRLDEAGEAAAVLVLVSP